MTLAELYKKNYKQLLIVTIVLLLVFSGILVFNKVSTGEFVSKDVSLRGGTLITVQTTDELSLEDLESSLAAELGSSVSIKRLQAFGGSTLGYSFTIEQGTDNEAALDAIRSITGLDAAEGSFTVEEVSSGLSDTFWQNTLLAIGIAFIAMSFAVMIFFRLLIPSLAVILAGASDLIGTLAVMNVFGMELSIAGVAALLMIVGYSVDTDILLTARFLKLREQESYERLKSAVKTGLTMQLTAIAAMAVLFFVSPAQVLKQIAGILIIGLLLDMPFTWIQNAGIMRWYLERKEKKHGQG
jgi:preprotein translocase subunit SecF